LSQPQSTALAQLLGITPLMLTAVRTQIAPSGCPDEVIALYFHRCKNIGADPFGRQLYIAHRRQKLNDAWEDRWMIETTIDGLRSIGESTNQYDGQDAPVYEYDNDGRLVSATVTIFRKDISRGITATAFFSEYVQLINGSPSFMWTKMPHNQLAKCAEALAYRKAFPRQLGGVYTDVEMEQAGDSVIPNVTPATGNNGQPAALNSGQPHGRNGRHGRNGEKLPKADVPITDAQAHLIARRLSKGRSEDIAELNTEETATLQQFVKEATANRKDPIDDANKLTKREASTVLDRILHPASKPAA
jgi:phage recombination protein Bet